MTSKTVEELIAGDLDCTNTPDDALSLAHEIERDPALLDRLEDQRRAHRALASVGIGEPPTGVLGSLIGGETAASRKVTLGIAAAALIAIAFLAVRGIAPVPSGVEATVGAARSYPPEPMTSKDVIVAGAAVQTFLQSEAFARLARSPEARRALANDKVRAALATPGMAAILANPDLLAAFASTVPLNAELGNVLLSADARAALASAEVRSALANPEVRTAFGNADLQLALKSVDFSATLARADAQAALQSAEFRTKLASEAAMQN